jgi:hypothetical protein
VILGFEVFYLYLPIIVENGPFLKTKKLKEKLSNVQLNVEENWSNLNVIFV